MSEIELFELSWYIRDHLFRRYNTEGAKIVKEKIPFEMVNTYLRYRDSDMEHINDLTMIVLENCRNHLCLHPLETKNFA